MKKEILKKQNGITILALVITIVVMLILAGITIGAITGDNRNTIRSTEVQKKKQQ